MSGRLSLGKKHRTNEVESSNKGSISNIRVLNDLDSNEVDRPIDSQNDFVCDDIGCRDWHFRNPVPDWWGRLVKNPGPGRRGWWWARTGTTAKILIPVDQKYPLTLWFFLIIYHSFWTKMREAEVAEKVTAHSFSYPDFGLSPLFF